MQHTRPLAVHVARRKAVRLALQAQAQPRSLAQAPPTANLAARIAIMANGYNSRTGKYYGN